MYTALDTVLLCLNTTIFLEGGRVGGDRASSQKTYGPVSSSTRLPFGEGNDEHNCSCGCRNREHCYGSARE